jgi:hypothetical protein
MAAYLGVLLVLTIPGVLVAYGLRVPLGTLLTWAAVPLFSLASVFVLGEFTSLTGLPFGIPAFVFLILVLGVAAIVRRVWPRQSPRHDLRDQPRKPTDEGRREEKVSYGLLSLGVLIGSFIWLGALRDVPLVLPGADGTRHGFFVGRIIHSESIDVSHVLVAAPDGLQVVEYFPLGGHASAALATRLLSADTGAVLVALTVVFAAIVLPLGMFVLARYLAPQRPLVAGFTSFAVPALTLFPYTRIAGGQVFAIVSMAMVPAAIVMVARVVLNTHQRPGSPLQMIWLITPAALALLAVTSVHSSELPLVLFLVFLLALERAWLERHLRLLAHALVRGLAVGLLAVALFAPTLGAFLAGASERSSARALGVPPGTDWTELFWPIVTLRTSFFPPGGFAAALPAMPSVRQYLFAALAFVGAAIWLRYRRVAWVVGWVTVIVLSLFASTTDNPVVRALSFPWYSGSFRITSNQVFFVPFFAGVVLAIVVPAVARTLRRRSAVVPATLVVAALFTLVVGIPAYRTSWSFLHNALAVRIMTAGNQARVDSDSEAAFQWLAMHTNENETVINEPTADGSLWMYAQRGVKPLLALAPEFSSDDQSARRDWENRRDLVRQIDEPDLTPRLERLIRDYHARWIYFDSRTYPLGTHDLDLDALRNSPHISEVFHRDTVYIFEIKPPDP